MKTPNDIIRKWGLILAAVWMPFLLSAQQPEHGWSGDNPEQRAGGCPFFTLTPNPTAPTCNGFSNGVASVTPSGGVGPYTYNWVGGPSTQTWNNLGAGTYTVIVFDQGQGGLPCNIDVFVNEPGPLTVFGMNAVAPTCFGACNGEAAPVIIGGNGGYSLSWSSGESGYTPTQLCNPFTLTITDSKGCVLDSVYVFDDAPEDILITADSVNVSCFGESDGAIDITVTGGQPNYTYAWTGPGGFTASSEDITGLVEGIYSVTITDVNGCEASASFEITAPDELELIGTVTANPCAGDTLGAVSVIPDGGLLPYTLDWTGPDGFTAQGENITGLGAGTYEVTLTDGNNCTLSVSFEVVEPPAIDIQLAETPIDCFGDTNGAIDATITGGAGDFTFDWSGPDGFTSSAADIDNLTAGAYTIVATDSSGCSNTATLELLEPDSIHIAVQAEDITCAGNNDGTISVSASGGAPDYVYSWSGPNGFSSADSTLSGLEPGTYTLTLTDANGCQKELTVEVEEPELLELTADVTDNFCAGQENGAIDLTITGGTTPYSISWTGPEGFTSSLEDIIDLGVGDYIVEVVDSSNCVQTETFTVSETNPLDLSFDVTELVCPDDANGAIDLTISGGTPDFEASWTGPDGFTSTQIDLTGLLAGIYNVEVTDANGCEAVGSAEVMATDTMQLDAIISPISCVGNSDGAISLSVSGGAPEYSYAWTGPGGFTSSSADISGLAAGSYTVVVTDANDCATESTFELTEPVEITVSGVVTDITCLGVFDGAIDLSVSGGNTPYTFQWSGPGGFTATTEDISGLNTGTYGVVVTDSLGCSANTSFEVGFGQTIFISGVVTDASCNSDNGEITAEVSGGVLPFSIIWVGPDGFFASTYTITDLVAGTYTLIAIDATDCYTEMSFVVNNPSTVSITGVVTDLQCAGYMDGAIDLTLDGADSQTTVSWSGPGGFTSTNQDISGLIGGTYTVSVTDSLGCIIQEAFSVNEPTPIDLSLIATQPSCGTANGAIVSVVSGGTISGNPYTYFWTNENNNLIGTGSSVSGLGSGVYTLTVSDDNACTTSQTVTLSETDIEIDAQVTGLDCNGDTEGSIELTVTGGFTPYSFDWVGPNGYNSSTQDIFDLAGGDYTLLLTDSLGCIKEETYQITEPDSIEILVSVDDITCNGEADGTISATTSGGTPSYTYSWIGPNGFTSTDSLLTDLEAGTYSLTVTDANGCAGLLTATINEATEVVVDADVTPVLCSGFNEGAIAVVVTGGAQPYSISWTGPDGFTANQPNITDLAAGDYLLILTDGNGCVFSETYTVVEQDPIIVDATISPIGCDGSPDGSISLSVSGGTPTYSYAWTGPDGFTSTAADITGLSAGIYTVVVTDSNDCFVESSFDLTEADEIVLSGVVTDITCLGVFDGAIDLTVSGGNTPYTFQWSGPGGFTATTEDISGLNTGTYGVVVTDSLGCSANTSFEVGFGQTIFISGVVTDASCNSDNGEITAEVSGGVPPFSIIWVGPDGFFASTYTITNLVAGTYTLTAIDATDCYTEMSFVVNNPSTVSITGVVTDLQCAGYMDGAIDLTLDGADSQTAVSWAGPGGFTSTNQDITGLAGGTYTVSATDSLGCIIQETFSVNEPTPFDLSLIATQPSCGNANGAIVAVVSGGTTSDGSYTYFWTDENNNLIGTGNSVSGLGSGVYTLTVSDDNACSTSQTITLSETDIEIDALVTGIDCNGDADGSIELTVTGGFTPYSFDWVGPDGYTASTQDIFDMVGGEYILSLTDSLGCIKEETYQIAEPDSLSLSLSATDPLCAGNANGEIEANVSGGSPGYVYSWTGPDSFSANTANIENLVAGSYTVEVADTNGCVIFGEVVLTAPDSLLINASIENIACYADSSGAIGVEVSGGTPEYDLSWTGPNGFISSLDTLSNLLAGAYSLQITDDNGCILDTTFVITEPDSLFLIATVSPINCFGDNNASISVVADGGTEPYLFVWSGPNGFISGEAEIDSLLPGAYQLLLTDSLGCAIDTTFNIEEPAELLVETNFDQPSCLESNGAIFANVSGGTIPYVFQWEDENGVVLSVDSALQNVPAGLYTLTVTDANGCSFSDMIPLSDVGGEILADITPVTCFGEANGAISVTVLNAIEPLEYAWTSLLGFTATTADIDNLIADTYYLLVTDSLGCTTVDAFEVTQPDSLFLLADVQGVSCFGADGSISAEGQGGTAPYTIDWTGPDSFTSDQFSISDLLEGVYTATLTDSVGCEFVEVYTIELIPPLSLAIDAVDITCNGASDGSAEAIVSGGTPDYTLIWTSSNGFTSDSAAVHNLEPGYYEVHITDANGCVITDGVTINEPDSILLTVSVIQSSCGNNDGNASVAAIGGTVSVDYTYSWLDENGIEISTGAGVSNLAPGSYTVVVTDDNGCSAQQTVIVSDADGLIEGIVTEPSCSSGDDGAISITVTGGTEPYTYSWTGPDGFASTEHNLDSLYPGEYIVEVTDSLGCVFVKLFELAIPQTLDLVFDVTPITCFGETDGAITMVINGGIEPYIIDWQGPDGFSANTLSIIDLAAGNYTVTVTDSVLCSQTTSIMLTAPAEIDAEIVVTDNLCADDTNGTLTVTVSGGYAPYTFEWTGPDGFESQGQSLAGLPSGLYELQITDSAGCSALFATEIISSAAMDIALSVISPICYGDSTASISAEVLGGTPSYDYQWTGPDGFVANSATIADLLAGSYQLMVTDSNGCVATADTTIFQPDSLFIEPQVNMVSCFGENDGQIAANVQGGVSPYTITWTGPDGFSDTTEVVSGLVPGVYDLSYSDSLGCMHTQTIEITEPDELVVSLESLTDALCSSDSSGTITVEVLGGTMPYEFTWFGPDGFEATTQNIGSLFPGDYTLQVADTNGCAATLNATVDYIFEVVANAGIDTMLCENEQPYLLYGESMNADSVWWTNADGELLGGLDTLSVLNLVGSHTYVFHASNGLCVDADSVVITINGLPVVDAGPNHEIVEGETVQIGGSPTSYFTDSLLWIPNITLSDSTVANPYATPIITTTYEVIAVDSNGCVNTDFVVVTVFPDINISTGISPNGDGYNDTWIIDHIEQFPDNVVELYNRWGDLLERYEGYDNSDPWEGYYNGKQLPVGTYYYIIELNDERFPEPYTGPLTIFR